MRLLLDPHAFSYGPKQAVEEGLTIVSADRVFVKYGVPRVW